MSLATAINPVRIAKAINPAKTARYVYKGIVTKDAKAVANTMYWFGGLICTVVAVLNPLLMNHQYKKKGIPDSERKQLVFQEAANQAVSVAIQFFSYFGLSKVVENILKRNPANSEPYIDGMKILLANFGGFIGQALIRPLLGSSFLMKWQAGRKQKAAAQSAPKMQAIPAMQGNNPNQDAQLQSLMQMLQGQGAEKPQPRQQAVVPPAATASHTPVTMPNPSAQQPVFSTQSYLPPMPPPPQQLAAAGATGAANPFRR